MKFPGRYVLAMLLVGVSVGTASSQNSTSLQIFFVDVEGGQATLFVTPQGQSFLIDTGWPEARDLQRISDVAKLAKLSRIDYVLITHYHHDHVGGVPALVGAMPVGTFIDHGPLREPGTPMDDDYLVYQKLLAAGNATHLVPKPGDKLPIQGLDATVVSSDGELIDHSLVGADGSNPYCKLTESRADDHTENARSLGVLLTFGKVRILDLGDLTWDKEVKLMCPVDKLGKVDIYVVSHHGFEQSGSPALVHAIAPRIAVMDNAAEKGGSPSAWQILHDSPGLQGLWQLHYSTEGGKTHNSPDKLIANIGGKDEGNYIKVTASPDGAITVFNSRTHAEKQY